MRESGSSRRNFINSTLTVPVMIQLERFTSSPCPFFQKEQKKIDSVSEFRVGRLISYLSRKIGPKPEAFGGRMVWASSEINLLVWELREFI